jgi:hypothetical protein
LVKNSSETDLYTDGSSTNLSSVEVPPNISANSETDIHSDDSTGSIGLDLNLKTSKSNERITAFRTPLRSFAFPERGRLNNRQFDYMVAHFKNYIKSFVTDNQTPFIHPFLYQEIIPNVYQDALGICSLVRKPHYFPAHNSPDLRVNVLKH